MGRIGTRRRYERNSRDYFSLTALTEEDEEAEAEESGEEEEEEEEAAEAATDGLQDTFRTGDPIRHEQCHVDRRRRDGNTRFLGVCEKTRRDRQVRGVGAREPLYQVVPEKQTSIRGLMGSDRGYELSGLAASTVPVLGDERGTKVRGRTETVEWLD